MQIPFRLVSVFAIASFAASAHAQDTGHHGGNAIFAAQAGNADDARGIAGGATAVFQLAGPLTESTLAYELTFNDIGLKPPWRIVIRNGSSGASGDIVHTVCGADTEKKCPDSVSGKLVGEWSHAEATPFTADLRYELTAGRLYLAVEEAEDEDAMLRGQIDTSTLMIMPKTRVLSLGKEGNSTEAAGTGVVFVTVLPGGKTQVDYALTVTGMTSPVESLALAGAREGKPVGAAIELLETARSKPGGNGITVSGVKLVTRHEAEELLRSLEGIGGLTDALLIRTEKSPRGEALTPLTEMPQQ